MLSFENTFRWPKTVLVCAAALAVFAVLASPARTEAQYTLHSDIAYGPPAKGQADANLLDIYVPEEDSPRRRPVFVWIHGGGWFKGDKTNGITHKARTLVDAGYIFVSINYRVSPALDGKFALTRNRLRFPTHHKDAARALGWINRNIGRYGGNSNRMLIGGDSAGGQISSLLATRPAFLRRHGMSTRQIKGVFSLDTVGFNVPRMMTPAYRRISAGFQKMMFNAFGTPAEEKRKPHWAAASPLRFADRSDPPIFHVVPTTSPDRWVDAKKMANRLRQRIGLVSHRVRTDHPGVVPLLGNPEGDMGVTAPLMRFASDAINPVRRKAVVNGSRVVSAGGAMTGVIRLNVRSRPAARLVTCRLDRGRERLCAKKWRLRVGQHHLRVKIYDSTGRAVASRAFRLRVTR